MLVQKMLNIVSWFTLENYRTASCATTDSAARQDQRESAVRYSRGNIAIQAGVFVTEADLERQRVEVASIAFPR